MHLLEEESGCFVLQEHHALSRELPSLLKMGIAHDLYSLGFAVFVRVFEKPQSEFDAQYTAHCIIDQLLGDFPRSDLIIRCLS